MTAFPGVDLNGTAAGCANTFGVVQSLLITFDHSKFVLVFDLVDRIAEQCGLTASGTGNKIQRQDAVGYKLLAVLSRLFVVGA